MTDAQRTREIAAWLDAYERVRALVTDLDPDQAALRVPTTPAWSVRDLLAHMVGLGVDVVAGREPEDHDSRWTQGHVDARAASTISDLLAEWADVADPLVAWMREHRTRPLGDVVIHEQDLRGALGVPGGRQSAGLRIVREQRAEKLTPALEQVALEQVAPEASTLEMRGDTWSHRWGPGPAQVVLEAPDYDLFRALTSRRSADQLRSWTVLGDVEPLLPAFAALGALPEDAIEE